MEPTVRVGAGLLVFVGMVGKIWAMGLQMKPGGRTTKLMIAAPVCVMIGFGLLLGLRWSASATSRRSSSHAL